MARPVTAKVRQIKEVTTPLNLTAPYGMYFSLPFILIFKTKSDVGQMLLFPVYKLIQTTNSMWKISPRTMATAYIVAVSKLLYYSLL